MQGQQRPQSRGAAPVTPPKSTSLKRMITVAILITAIVLIIAFITGAVALAFSGVFDGIFDKNDSGYTEDDGGKDKPAKPSQKPADTSDPTVVKADITLPSTTPAGSYLSSYASNVKDISGISSAAAVLVSVGDGKVIARKEADAKIYPASMTKVMTLLVACENATVAGKLLTVEQWMIDYQQRMGASGIMGFKAGEQISLENALYLINYNSDTVACLLVAQYISGSEAAFVELMNKKAQSLGLTGTHFTNTTGLHDDNHYTTCKEMAAIMNCAMKNPVASKIISAHSGRGISVYVNNTPSRSGTIYAAWFSDDHRFDDDARVSGTSGNMTVIGGKTGYEDIPTACFVTVAEHNNGQRYICVTVGRTTGTGQATVTAKQSTTDTETIYREYAYKQ